MLHKTHAPRLFDTWSIKPFMAVSSAFAPS